MAQLDNDIAAKIIAARDVINQPGISAASQMRLHAEHENSRGRSLALKFSLWIYAGWMTIEALLVLNQVSENAQTAMLHAKETIQLFVLPVLTLVIGHYLGRSNR